MLKYREAGADEEIEEPADPTENLEEVRILSEQLQAVREAVDQIAGRCRSLIEALYLDPRHPSYDVIGQELDMPVASIGPTRARCLEKLRMILRRRGINK
jgi:DNA-directed RNA polymerase specialized sigma24 family protein